jgi:WD40 repeat protein
MYFLEKTLTPQEWDLNTGFVARSYPNNTGQISSIRFRPSSSVPIYPVASPPKPVVAVYDDQRRGSLASNNSLESLFGDESPNGTLNDAMLDSVIDNDQPTTQETVSDPSSSGQQICRDIFLTSSFDGGISLWDRRRDGMVARLATGSKGAPPWCTSV